MAIPRFIREQVIPAGMSVTAAAQELGVGRVALSNLLNGKSTLSQSMALKLERSFGADANDLMRRQAREGDASRSNLHGATRQPGGSILKITSTDIAHWADTIGARVTLPVLLRRLVHADIGSAGRIDFPGNDAGQRKGWDGFTDVQDGGIWVPQGKVGWELSSGDRLPAKPESDMKERSKLPASERADTTFVFVTARNWEGRHEWARKHRASGGWRDVRAYDASDLEQWLEVSPTAQIWFAGEIGRTVDGAVPIGECWRHWSQSTSPEMSPILFEETVSERRASLHGWIDGDSERPFVVSADSADEALAFLAIALKEEDGTEGEHYDRAVFAATPDALAKVAAASRAAILVVAGRETEIAAASLTRRNRVIVVRPKTSVERDANIEVATPSYEAFGRALTDMDIEQTRQDQLRKDTGLSPTILRRQLALTAELRRPRWATDRSLVRKLMPMLLAGAWNRTVEADRMLVADLAGTDFSSIEADLTELLQLPEAPVWAIGNFRGLVSRKDAFFTAGAELGTEEIDRFFEVAHFVLTEDDPALDLEPNERWSAGIYGKKREISGAMRAAVGELLVLLSVYGDRVLGSQVEPVANRVDRLVASLLTSAETRAWLSRQSDLPLLAEAAPEAFLAAVEQDLSSSTPQILAMLRPVEAGSFDSPDRTGLLWGLEAIAWNEDRVFRVARILARLSEVPITDNWVNKPEGSLESLIRSWLPQTAAPIERRIALLDMLVREFPEVAWRVCFAQLGEGHRSASPNNMPRWRTDAAGVGGVTWEENDRMRQHALTHMLSWPNYDVAKLGDLISISADLSGNEQQTIWGLVSSWIENDPTDADRAALRERMRGSVLSRRQRGRRGRTDRLAPLRQEVFEMLAPRNLVARHKWLFADHWIGESGDELWDDEFDYDRHERRIDELRKYAVEEIYDGLGFNGLSKLLEESNAWHTVGRYLALAAEPTEREGLIRGLVDRAGGGERWWPAALGGAIHALEPEERAEVITSLLSALAPESALVLLRAAPFEMATWRIISNETPELKDGYWRTVQPAGWGRSGEELGTLIDEMLAADRPISAFNATSHEFKMMEGETLARLMKALVAPTSEASAEVQLHAGRIGDALEALEASGVCSLQELAHMEYVFIKALDHSRHGIRNLEKQIGTSPADFVQLVTLMYNRDDGTVDPNDPKLPEGHGKLVFERVYSALHNLRRTPGTTDEDKIDPTALLSWLVDVRERLRQAGRLGAGDSEIGQMLGRSKPGPDGVWPAPEIRDALEACNSERMLRGMEIGLFNNRGATWRGTGGSEERTLANRYRGFARQVQDEHPVTARLLERVARMWDDHAEWHDTDDAVRQRLGRW